MIPPAIANSLSSLATEYGAPLANHLWQSTAFAGLVWLLTLLLRKNRAQARYLLWLVASAKFLLPFGLLTGLGRLLAWPGTAAVPQPRLFLAMETIGQPFSLPNPPPVSIAAALSMWEVALRNLPIFLAMAWFAGCVAVIVMWYLRWQPLNTARRAALPSSSGREFEALRRTEQSMRSSPQISLVLSSSSLEPGILGILRPVLVLPAGISDRLTDVQLDSVITHELCHVRRRDNLASAFHMLVEALFWFHPLVWWMGTRLVEERERACDEEVLRLGADPHVYAEGILKVCKFYLEPPLLCAAGVTGSNLKKRIEAIMMNRKARNLDFSRKLLLGGAGFLAVLVPIALGFAKPTKGMAESQAQDPLPLVPAFESAMIRPNNGEPMAGFTIIGKPFNAIMWKGDRLMATNFTLHGLIRVAYGVPDDQIIGGPDWLNTEGFDVDAKMGKSVVDEMQTRGQHYGVSGRTLMFQKLLSDRFKLSFHRETRDIPVYVLVVAPNGSRLQPAKPGDTYDNGLRKHDGSPLGANTMSAEPGKLVGQGIHIARLVEDLSGYVHRTVLNKTGLTDKYDFTLQWTPDESQPAMFAAIQDQLGLKLEPQIAPVEVLVIDHAEQIGGNEAGPTPPQIQSTEKSQAVTAPANSTGSLSCTFASVKYPEGSIIQEGNGPEQLCARVLDPGKLTANGQPQYTEEWIHTSPAIRERGKNVIHPPAGPPAVCTPKPSTQSNLCSCEESSPWSENAIVDSTSGGKLNCKKGKWVPIAADHAKQTATEEPASAPRSN